VSRAVAVALALAGITLAIARSDVGAASLWRHAYHVPVVVAALRGGAAGALVALAAVLLYAPFVLPALERSGPTPAVLEGLLTFALLLGVGVLSAALATGARRQRARHDTLLAVQRAVDGDTPLEVVLARVRACLEARLAGSVGLAVADGARVTVAGGVAVAPGSAVARVLATGRPLFVSDLGGDVGRPRRCFVAPLPGRDGAAGALALERAGDLGAGERRALLALAAHVGLALENARLAARQRRFAEELSEKVAAATRQVVEIDRMKSEFVAIASHELRTPLTALQGFSELLATRRFAPAEIARLGAIMSAETERLGRIVSDFLDLSRLERGLAPPLRRARVDAATVVADAVEVLRRGRVTHALEVECAGGLPALHADRDALDRVVKNLVANAVKYSPAGSRVRVAARPLTMPPAVEIVVEDEGPGIADVDLARVFEPYYRAAGAARAAGGVGLGLAVVKSLVDAHGGSIRAENVAPHGTRMTLILPALP
jgi:two-component system, OmpR family, sensor histidine kinase KdpD